MTVNNNSLSLSTQRHCDRLTLSETGTQTTDTPKLTDTQTTATATDSTGTDKLLLLQGGPKKPHKVNDKIILQPYVTESCGFQQNVLKEISYVTKVNI